ncbi:hypothetical protein UR09_04445 [Candidatus Nitromaritima sp. SCGC AAA799-A02]|nr:hypothetical protein UR09_04445 [Candidatus Nitromaritima sp. SCGC AAA799-A02]KMP12015.1 hypothetical protein UZ36_02250 [Candidatus Nitromaritima sp. SCGC AAA799-C22]
MKIKETTILILILFLLTLAGQGGAEEKYSNSWITMEEAALPAMKPPNQMTNDSQNSSNHTSPVSKKVMPGPIIHVEKPDPDQLYDDLIDILISFKKNPIGEPVNMESLRVIYLKMFGIDITDRILPYVKETHIDANGIKFPEGEHEFEIRIKDNGQMESSEIIKIKVN